jgi:hypothetical protein
MTPALLYRTCNPPKVSTAIDGSSDGFLVGHVAPHVGGLATSGRDRLDRIVAVRHVGDDHLGPLGGETLGADAAEP